MNKSIINLFVYKERTMKEINSFKLGIVSGIPICVGYFSVAFAFGIFSIQSGLNILEAFLISACNLTSAGQFAGVPIICAQGSIIELAITQLVINSRYALMSISLSQKLGSTINNFDRFILSFANTDEVFAVASSNKGNVGKRYMYGLIIPPILGWTMGTLFGAFAGDILPEMVTSALGIAIYGMFIAIVVPQARKEKATLVCMILSLALSCLFYYLPVLKNNVPSGFTIIICSVIASAIMAMFSPLKTEEEENA